MNSPEMNAHLDALRIALASYLGRLQDSWASQPGAGTDVGRLLAGTGLPPVAGEADRKAFRDALARGREHPLSPLGLDRAEEMLAAAAWWAETDPQVAVAFGCAHDDGARRYPSCGLLRLVLAPFGLDVPPELGPGARLVRDGVLMPDAGPDGPLRLTPTARRVLAGVATAGPEPGAPPDRHAGLVERLARHRDGPVVLRGPEGTGRHAVAAAAAKASGRTPVLDALPAPEVRLLARLGTVLPVVPAAQLAELGDSTVVAVAAPEDPVHGAYVVDMAAPDIAERRAHWARALRGTKLPKGLAAQLAARFAFTEGDIDRALARARTDAAWRDTPLDAELVWDAARRHPEHSLAKMARLVRPVFTLDDIALPDDVRAQLDEIVAHVRLQDVVLDDWGFRRRMPRGQGVAALLSGPSGTGKTMAAEAIAAELGQDLYTVDLSAVVSKYIGETEKNLALAFGEAEKAAAVLFFDECDSTFGKRTEQHDARDRWANLEVNYLLQRVETFTGLVLLATNRKAALDEAFLRRLRFSVRFEMPDYALRRDIWQRAFPLETPVAGLDWENLARREIAGGNIQVAAVSAAFLAAARGDKVRTEHVEHALRREYDKLGKAWSA